MRAVIYLVSGVLLGVLLLPAPLAGDLRGSPTSPALPELPAPPAALSAQSSPAQSDAIGQVLTRGTNNVATDTLLRAGLAPDALEKGSDRDADGDPDVLHIRLEAVPAAPWTLQPKAFGPSLAGAGARLDAQSPVRLPDLHLELGDRVLLTLENSHSQPVRLHFAGESVLALTPAGLSVRDAAAVPPGAAFTWLLHPLREGTADYAGGPLLAVDTPQGRVLVTANLPGNTLQSVEMALRTPAALSAVPVPPAQDAPAPAVLTAAQLLQLSGFGLALGLALAGLLGLLLPQWTARLQEGAPR